MGFYEALRNLAVFMIMLNLGASLAAAIFPDFRIAIADNTELIEQLEQQTESITPQSTSLTGDLVTAFGIAKFFFGNLVTGNYYLWKSLGLDTQITISGEGNTAEEGMTFAKALSLITVLIYALGMMEFLRGKV